MNRLGLLLLCALFLLTGPGRPSLAQYYYDYDYVAEAALEAEALIEALDEFGLDLDSPELEGMDDGEAWGYVERLQREMAEAARD